MNNVKQRALSLLLSIVLILGVCAFYTTDSQTVNAQSTDAYGLAENVKDGAILHAWCWSFKTIQSNLEKIASAGFSSVQTSPINQCKVGEGGGMDLSGKGKWYYHYQPTLFTIGNYQLGTLQEFKSLCTEAKKYGIKIIVDVVANHCSSDYGAISNEVKNISGGAFHDGFGIGSYSNRYQCTQGQLLSLYDLNTQNTNVQQMILKFLKDCVSAGASGFRYDAAKHIELPDEQPVDGKNFKSEFWPVILNNGSEFQYGEILQGDNERIDAYAKYMSVTASNYGGKLRGAASNSSFNANDIKDYLASGVSNDKLVTWVESHDNYTGDGSWNQLNNQQIRYSWAVISARGNTTPLFFNRPDGSSTSSQWGKNKIGPVGDSNYYHPEVVAVNQFRNAMIGQPEKLSNPTNDNSVLMIERGNAGAVIINSGRNDITLDTNTSVTNGTYQDAVSGSTFTVSNSKLSGTVKAGTIAVIYNDTLTKLPSVSISQDGGVFRGTLELTLTARNADTSTYKIGSAGAVKFNSGDKIQIGSNMTDGESVNVVLTAIGSGETVSKTYTFTKQSAPVLNGTTVVYFDNSQYNWDEVSLYAYRNDNGVISNHGWPGVLMEDLGGGMYGYVIDESWDSAYVIFNNNDKGIQFPSEVGYEINKGEHKIFNGSGLSDYIIEIPTQPTTLPITSQPTSSQETTPQPTSSQIITQPVSSAESTEKPIATSSSFTTFPTLPVTTLPIGNLYGDADLNGSVNIKDATLIQKYLLEYVTFNQVQMYNSDVNGNGIVSIKDATLIQKKAIDIISKFPVEK